MYMGSRRAFLLTLLAFTAAGDAQIIEFESNGLRYKTLTRNGLTIMFATLHRSVREWAIMQVAISNGSPVSWAVRPEDFWFESADGRQIEATPANTVVSTMIQKAGRGDVIKLVTAYEAGLYGNAQMHTTNGYEARRESALAEVGSNRIRAAAAASAIALVTTKLSPGQSTDGAVFYPNQGKPLGAGQLRVHAAGEEFVFPVDADPPPGTLSKRH